MKKPYFENWLPKLVLAPSLAVSLVCVYGFIVLTIWLSFTRSRILPNWALDGTAAWQALFESERWWHALYNLAIFGTLFILLSLSIGIVLAIFLDQKIRAEGFLRALYLYPMALSFIVTGTAWKWLFNPGIGIEKTLREWGWHSATFDWIVNPDMAIYCVVIAAVWQASGFVMALFLSGLRGIDKELHEAAQVDGAGAATIYRRIVLPLLAPVFVSAILILAHIAIKSFDLVMALTAGGPGTATDLPAILMYQFSFARGQLAQGAASSLMMLATVLAVLVPTLYAGTRQQYSNNSGGEK